MINFRYHVVSLTAVFLALAIGLVVGTAALNGPVADRLNDTVNGLRNQNSQLRDQVVSMNEEVNRQEDFAKESAPHLVAGTLTGRRVVVVALPGSHQHVDGVVEMLGLAGAKVTARVKINDKLIDPGQKLTLLDLADDTRPTGIGNLPDNSDGVETSAALLAAVLLDRTPTVDTQDLVAVVEAYKRSGYISVDTAIAGPAEAVVMVAGDPAVDRESDKKNAAAVTVATQFDVAGPMVLAGSSATGTGNVVGEVRGDPALSKTISTVDNVNTAMGRVVTTMAVYQQLHPSTVPNAPKAGHYGIDAAQLMPKPAG